MKLEFLDAVSKHFDSYEMIYSVRRVDDNLLRLTLDFDEFYIDVSKSKSSIFQTQERILGNPYRSPFDLALSKYCSRAKLLSCRLDGENRILIFELLTLAGYKQMRCFLHFELTGKHTNVVLVSQDQKVIEALRHIGEFQSSRIIKPNKPFKALAQPSKKHIWNQNLSIHQLKEEFLHNYQTRMQGRISQKKQALIAQRQKKIKDLSTLFQRLPNPAFLEHEARKYTLWGELIFSSILPSYFSHDFELKDHSDQVIKITLPPKIRSFSQGGNFCFTQSKKFKQKLCNLEIQKEYLSSKISFLQKELEYIESIEDERDLGVFFHKTSYKQKQERKDYESFFVDGIKVSIGKNAKENQKLLQDARADDLWLHIQDIPSSHMIIHCGKTKVREEVLRQSAKILLGMNGIGDKNIAVDYTHRRFVKIIEGANVVYSKQKTLNF